MCSRALYSGIPKTSNTELFATIVNDYVQKLSILDVFMGHGYTSAVHLQII